MGKQTSKGLATKAGEIMSDENSSQIQKRLAGSILAQRGNSKETSEEMEGLASMVLKSSKYSDETKSLAASSLSQATKKPWENW